MSQAAASSSPDGPPQDRGVREATFGQGGEFIESWIQERPKWPLRLSREQFKSQARVLSRRRFWPREPVGINWPETARRWARLGRLVPMLWPGRRQRKPGRLVVLWDVSGSMANYIPLYLPWVHRLAEVLPEVGVFPFGTDIGEITAALKRPYAQAARTLLGVRDLWAGGTAIGQAFLHWLEGYGDRWLGPDTTVVIISDGWDVGEPEALAHALADLRRRTRSLLWINPLAATPGFEAKTRGLRTARRFVAQWAAGASPVALLRLSASLL